MTLYQKIASSLLLIAVALAIVACIVRSATGGDDRDEEGEPMEK